MLAQVDLYQSERIGPLHEQKGLILSLLSGAKAISAILDAEQPDVNFLRISEWLEDAADQQAIGLKEVANPSLAPANLNFVPDNGSDVQAILKKVGRVSDRTLDVAMSSLVCQPSGLINTNTTIGINARNTADEPITAEEAEISHLQVELVSADNEAIPGILTMTPVDTATTSMAAKYTDQRQLVSARYRLQYMANT